MLLVATLWHQQGRNTGTILKTGGTECLKKKRRGKSAQFVNWVFVQQGCCRRESSSFIGVSLIMALCSGIRHDAGKRKRRAKWQWNEGGKT